MITLATSDNKQFVDIGGSDIWNSVYATAEGRLGLFKRKIPLALQLFKTGRCSSEDALETARQINLLRDEFSKYPPEKAIYDVRDLKKKAPWSAHISPVITSCANLYTTADGKDLLFEIVCILVYANTKKVDVSID